MKSFWKFLSRNKFYTFIEVSGLALSLAFVTYVGCYTVQQFKVSREHSDCKRRNQRVVACVARNYCNQDKAS